MATLVVILFSGCFREVPVVESLLSDDELIPILKDIHVAEALLTEIVDRREKDSLARLYYGEIFRIHKVDTAVFNQSMHAYFTNPPALDSLYQAVMDTLAKEKAILGKKHSSASKK